MNKVSSYSDYVVLFGVICLIPTGLDGSLITPLWVSLSVVGTGLLGKLVPPLVNMLKQ